MNNDNSTLNLSELICHYIGGSVEVYGDDCCGQHYIVKNDDMSVMVGPYSVEIEDGEIMEEQDTIIRGMARTFDRDSFLTDEELCSE